MDFVDLDKVLDEFEEEEKHALSIVPGQELKPSGYIEFLEQHEEDFKALSSDKFPAYGGYTLERRWSREPSNVAYDEPYDSFSQNKLTFIADFNTDAVSINGYDKKTKNSQSEIVTNLSRVTPSHGGGISSVYPSCSAPDRKGIANSTERKGTIAYQPIEVQTDALSPTSEQELMSSPFPKSDIIVDGHDNTKTLNVDAEQNHSPIYASMDTINLTHSSHMLSEEHSSLSVSEDQTIPVPVESVYQTGNLTAPAATNQETIVAESSENEIISFHDIGEDEELDDTEVSMYLKNMSEDNVNTSHSFTNIYETAENEAASGASLVPDIQSDLHHAYDGQNRSLAEELKDAEHTSDGYVPITVESTARRLSGGHDDPTSTQHQNPDLVADIHWTDPGHAESKENSVYNSIMGEKMEIEKILEDVENNRCYNIGESVLHGKMEIEKILDGHGNINSHTYWVGENLLRGKLEIEQILDGCEQVNSHAYSVGESLLKEKMEIENILDRITESNKTFTNDKSKLSSHTPPDVTQNLENMDQAQTLDYITVSSSLDSQGLHMGLGARPKDLSLVKKNRPNSLLGLSKVTLDKPVPGIAVDEAGSVETCHQHHAESLNHFPDVTIPSHQRNSEVSEDVLSKFSGQDVVIHDFSTSPNGSAVENFSTSPQDATGQKTKRPTSLNIRKPEFNMEQDANGSDREDEPSPSSVDHREPMSVTDSDEVSSLGASTQQEGAAPVAMSQTLASNLGHHAPFWIPDSDAPDCMLCQTKFTVFKRRHHCRACGKVLCNNCCSQKALLPYMEKEARVCVECHIHLTKAPGSNPRSPNPNNPNEYCSKVPPNQQANSHVSPPVVMVPTGVLKSSGSQRRTGEPKQVMFSDGIRPGGDLTELDGPDQTRPRRSTRGARKLGAPQHQGSPPARKIKEDGLYRSPCLLLDRELPPLYILNGDTGSVVKDEVVNQLDYTEDFKDEGSPPIYFAVNKNVAVGVKIVNLDCCVNRTCWLFVTRGMCTAGQSELIVLLELMEEEMGGSVLPPRDIFLHFHYVYEEALKGSTIQDMGHSICHSNFLGSRDHGGFLYLRPSFQCLSKLTLPEAPYLFGILLQKWEMPWAKVFPIRLMLRLGAEYRYYPCPLVSVRNRKPVFYEIGHTIINLLADFRNYQYMLTQVRGVTIHMENKKTVISFPRNRYNDVMKVVRNSNEHVMALGSTFSAEADSHLVCIENEDGNYQTQAINIQNKPRLVTGASFVVFSGALKASTGLRAKSSIVEDGLMVQVLPETMASIKEALKEMTSYTVQCGPVDSTSPEEMVELRWVDNDRNFNIGVRSYIDGKSLEGVESASVKSQSDFLGETLAIRWTRVYFLQHQDSTSSHFDPLDLSRLTENIAQACCTALVKHLDVLKNEGQVKLGLRVNLTRDSVGYEIGSKERLLPAAMMNNLDTFLVPIIHQASEEGIIMELVFNIVD